MRERLTNLAAQSAGRLAEAQETALERAGVRRLQAFRRDLDSFEHARPLVIALLIWVAWRAYRAERRHLERRRINVGAKD